jgi:4-hydroxy-4-methyl-2-oxoglutarate aldolase
VRHVVVMGSRIAGTVSINGECITPGDAVLADDDGVLVVPRSEVSRAVSAALARTERETAARVAFRRGELGLDRYGLRAVLSRLGVEYLDHGAYLDAQ